MVFTRNPTLFDQPFVKTNYLVDSYYQSLNDSGANLVSRTVYWWGFPDHGGKLQDHFILTLHSDTIFNTFLSYGLQMSIIYVVVLTYVKPLEEVDSQIPEHVEWLKKGYSDGVFLTSGRRVPRNGGVIIAKCDSVESLEERLRQDPFQKLNIAKVEIIPFEATMKAKFLENML